MNNEFANKLKQLREQFSYSLSELGDSIQKSKQAIHQYETGQIYPTSDTLFKLSEVFGKHPSFFYSTSGTEIKLSDLNFRQEKHATEEVDIKVLKDICLDYLKRLIEIKALVQEPIDFQNPIEDLPIKSERDIEKAAKSLRKKWKLGYSPISDVTKVVEDNGVAVIEVNVSEGFTGLSGFANENIPFMIVNSNCSEVTRKRFTLLHELGHLILQFSHTVSDGYRERLCDHFAGAVLLVDEVLLNEIGRHRKTITLEELRRIKLKYGASVEAIMIRAHKIELISQETLNLWLQQRNVIISSGFNTTSGQFSATEKPCEFNKLVQRGLSEQRITKGKAAELINIPESELKIEFNDKYKFQLA